MNEDWKDRLIKNKAGEPRALLANAMLAFRESPAWSGVLAYDEFAMQTTMAGPPPWEKGKPAWILRSWAEHDDLLATNWLQEQDIGVPLTITQQAIEAVARDSTFHPVKRYLEDLTHDGVPRLDTWLSQNLGATANLYHGEVGKVMLIGAVARIYRPGSKNDLVPILEGRQGGGKSTAMRTMFAPWFSDELAELGSKDAAMQTRSVWGLELSELDAMSRAEVSRIKAFISRATDRFRPPYGKRLIESPRSCILWGTTNSASYLKDETGARRFLPIKIGTIDIGRLQADRDQLWAEAVVAYKAGAPWWITDNQVLADAERQQEARYTDDPWDGLIANFIETRTEVTVTAILEGALHHLDKGRWTQADQNRIARCLLSRKWERRQRRVNGERKWVYERPVTASPVFDWETMGSSDVTSSESGDR
jgi:predicted P-loop ATPase